MKGSKQSVVGRIIQRPHGAGLIRIIWNSPDKNLKHFIDATLLWGRLPASCNSNYNYLESMPVDEHRLYKPAGTAGGKLAHIGSLNRLKLVGRKYASLPDEGVFIIYYPQDCVSRWMYGSLLRLNEKPIQTKLFLLVSNNT